MNKCTVTSFSQSLTDKPPRLIDCLGQEPPVLVKRNMTGQDELLQYWGTDDCKRALYPYNSQAEAPWYDFSKAHGFEIRNRLSTGVFHKRVLYRDLMPRNIYEASFVHFLGYLGEDRYLCLEAEDGGVVCKDLGGSFLWETKEKYGNASCLSVSVDGSNIFIHNVNEHILTVYTVDGCFVCTLKVPNNFLGGDGDSKFYLRDGSYFVEGFFDGHRIRGEQRLYGRAKICADNYNVEPLFKIELSMNICMCERNDDLFLYAGYGVEQKQVGDICWLLYPTSAGYLQKNLFFVPQPDCRVGGATVKWLDKCRFLYWNCSGGNTKLYCCNLQGKMELIAEGLGMLFESMVSLFDGRLYILHGLPDKDWNMQTYQLDIICLPT